VQGVNVNGENGKAKFYEKGENKEGRKTAKLNTHQIIVKEEKKRMTNITFLKNHKIVN